MKSDNNFRSVFVTFQVKKIILNIQRQAYDHLLGSLTFYFRVLNVLYPFLNVSLMLLWTKKFDDK